MYINHRGTTMIVRRRMFSLLFLSIVLLLHTDGKAEFNLEKYLGRWIDMWNSYDLAMVDELFLTDSRVTYLSSEREGVIKGIDAVREHHREFGFVKGGKDQPNKLWVDGVDMTDFGSTAVVAGVWYFKTKETPPNEVQRGPFTLVYVKLGDTYRIAHAHFGNY